MLARDPSLIRPRVELGRALFMAGQYSPARYHLEQALASSQPAQVRENVLNFLSLIRERSPGFGFSFDIVSDSNPKQAMSGKVVTIGGVQFHLNENARKREPLGAVVVGQGKVPLRSNRSWFARGYLEHFDYEGSALDQSYAKMLAGRHVNTGPHGVDFGAGWRLAMYADTTLYEGSIWRVSDFIRVRPTVGLAITLDAKNFRYRDFNLLTGWHRTASAEVRSAHYTEGHFAFGVSCT